MQEREKVQEREPELQEVRYYDGIYQMWAGFREQARTGKVVIRQADRGWETSRQGIIKWFLHPLAADNNIRNWLVFVQDIRVHSGRHRHQGGLAIFVLEGRGYTVVDGVKVEWEAGDLILLPIKPNGVEHQHFNREPGRPCKWMALIYTPFVDSLGNELEQVQTQPNWQEPSSPPPQRGQLHRGG